MMEKYKALLYREWKISKRFYILRIVLLLLFTALLGGVMVVTKNNGADVHSVWLWLLYLLVLFMAAGSAEDNGVYKSDVNSGWLKYSWALPLTAHEKAVTKFVFRGIVLLIGTIYMFVSIGVICTLSENPHMKTVVYAFFWCLDACLLFNVIRNLFIMYAVDKKTLKKMGTIFTIVLIVLIDLPYIIRLIKGTPAAENALEGKLDALFTSGDLSKLADLLTIPDLWGWIGILLTFVILIVSFLISLKSCERRCA